MTEQIDVKIISKDEKMWSDVVISTERQIEQAEGSLKINRAFLDVARNKLEEAKNASN